MRNNEKNLTDGPILSTLVKFALPILVALFLQAMYGAGERAESPGRVWCFFL
ncbi:hypothetical protein [Hornefia porci]|uniref:hypothetical protein n=1 Tax=Hornefia porci TaxID=2652292 RepID=UPI00268FFF67